MTATFHASPLSSQRMQKLLAALRSGPCTTMKLNELCQSTRASSDVSEARANGAIIACTYLGTNENGRRVHLYTLISEPTQENLL